MITYNTDFVEADFDTLLRQASMTAADYLANAQREIDNRFGDGYAAKNPNLVAAFMQTASSDFTTSATAKVLGASLLSISNSLSEIASALERSIE